MDSRPPRFAGKTALVTGGNSGIGLAVAQALAREGAGVVLAGRNADTVAAAEASIASAGGRAIGVVADASRLADLDRLVAEARAFGGGRIDGLFANAGVATFGSVAATTEAEYDALMAVNVKGVYFTVQKAIAAMGEGGSIVLNASVAAGKGNPAGALYGASKAAVRSMARTIGAELVARGIRVNTVSPGPVETPLFERVGAMDAAAVAGMKTAWAERNPMKRFGTVDEVAAAVLFLLSDEAGYTTGADLLVDGGLGSF
jgi:NAD(P)-dependent dehydrogenase (short-subunit alcohol dehydrogenase family)